MFEKLDIFRMSSAMAVHAGQKLAVTAQNVANSDTPGYKAKGLDDFRDSYQPDSSTTTLRASRERHLHGAQNGALALQAREESGESSPNGNDVSLEVEMLKAADAKSQHDRALAIYKSSLNILRTTIRK